jgi:hypothetical protein
VISNVALLSYKYNQISSVAMRWNVKSRNSLWREIIILKTRKYELPRSQASDYVWPKANGCVARSNQQSNVMLSVHTQWIVTLTCNKGFGPLAGQITTGLCRNILRNTYNKSRDSSVGIALGYGLEDRGSIPGGCWEFFSKTPRQERLWGPPSLLSNGYQGLFPWG